MADEKKQSFTMTTEELSSLVEKASAASVTAALKALQPEKAKDPLVALPELTDEQRKEFNDSIGAGICPECKQPAVKGRYACKGKHRLMAVYPSNNRHGKHFPGIMVNGALYRSDNPGHFIPVPKDCDVESLVYNWEQGEDDMRHGKESFSSAARKFFGA